MRALEFWRNAKLVTLQLTRTLVGWEIRHPTRQAKGPGSRPAALALMFQLGGECEKGWRRSNDHEQIPKLILGIRFIDGIEQKAA